MTQLRVGAVLFDLDGTLVDSTAVVNRSWRMIADELELPHAMVVGRFHGMTGAATLRIIKPSLTDGEVAELSGRLLDAEISDLDGVRATPGAVDALTGLPRENWAIVTSCPRALALARLEAAGLPVPAVMITAEDVDRGKPHPLPYQLGAQRMGLLPRACLAVEDAPAGVTSALSAGCRVVGVATTHSTLDVDTVSDLADITFRAESSLVFVRY
jgi:mannitol-1-/sugar-/sorbitol-6-phosphatase